MPLKPNFSRKITDCQTVHEWGSGLDRNGTQNTKPEHWPGFNAQGLLLKKLSKKVRKRTLSDSINRKQKQPNREQSKQVNIVQMLKELLTASDSDVLVAIRALTAVRTRSKPKTISATGITNKALYVY